METKIYRFNSAEHFTEPTSPEHITSSNMSEMVLQKNFDGSSNSDQQRVKSVTQRYQSKILASEYAARNS